MGIGETAKGIYGKATDGLNKAKDTAADVVNKATGAEALSRIDEFGRKFTLVLVGMHEDLRAQAEKGEAARQDLLQRVESLQDEFRQIDEDVAAVHREPQQVADLQRKLSELENAVQTMQADVQTLTGGSATSCLETVSKRLVWCAGAVGVAFVLALAALVVAVTR